VVADLEGVEGAPVAPIALGIARFQVVRGALAALAAPVAVERPRVPAARAVLPALEARVEVAADEAVEADAGGRPRLS
jgi:hypothetical protein